MMRLSESATRTESHHEQAGAIANPASSVKERVGPPAQDPSMFTPTLPVDR
jgi:hypothetical protein